MRVAILQTDIKWFDANHNLAQAENLILQAGKADVYVLPEMFATGFAVSPEFTAEAENGPIQQWMADMADKYDAAICGSIAVKEIVSCRNRFFFVIPGGQSVRYDKKHLFSMGGEVGHYRSGTQQVDVLFRDVRFRLAVCYDLRFPAWLRNNTADPYDALIVIANWPTPRVEAWNTLIRARAIENQAYVIGVNRVGSDPTCQYSGGSAIIDPYGKTAAHCPDNQEACACLDLDLQRLAHFRDKFPVLKERDDFNVK